MHICTHCVAEQQFVHWAVSMWRRRARVALSKKLPFIMPCPVLVWHDTKFDLPSHDICGTMLHTFRMNSQGLLPGRACNMGEHQEEQHGQCTKVSTSVSHIIWLFGKQSQNSARPWSWSCYIEKKKSRNVWMLLYGIWMAQQLGLASKTDDTEACWLSWR